MRERRGEEEAKKTKKQKQPKINYELITYIPIGIVARKAKDQNGAACV